MFTKNGQIRMIGTTIQHGYLKISPRNSKNTSNILRRTSLENLHLKRLATRTREAKVVKMRKLRKHQNQQPNWVLELLHQAIVDRCLNKLHKHNRQIYSALTLIRVPHLRPPLPTTPLMTYSRVAPLLQHKTMASATSCKQLPKIKTTQ